MRDDQNRLVCPLCSRPIGGVTGLEELHVMIAHLAEHHDRTVDLDEAMYLRVEWEKIEGR